MKNDIIHILQSLKADIDSHIVLGKSERVKIFDAIRVAATNQNSNKFAYPSPILTKRPIRSHIFFMNYASISLAAFLVMAGSLSFAAEKSLPGDALYVVKTNFNENVQGLLTFSSQSRAKLEAKFAENRLVEAQKLAVNNNLTEEQEVSINESFKKHSEEFSKSLEKINSKEDPATAASLSAEFQSTLLAHKNVISTIGDSESKQLLHTALQAEIASVDALRKDAEGKLASLSSKEIKAAASARAIEAEEAILSLEKLIEPQESTTTVSVSMTMVSSTSSTAASATIPAVDTGIEESVLDAHFMLEEGYRLLDEGKFIEAYTSFQESILIIQEAEQTLTNVEELQLSDEDKESALRQQGTSNASTSLGAILDQARLNIKLNAASSSATTTDVSPRR
ncbi:MAG TPA: DUF5667 domain-containing protein [Candidatus Paceibacterota bacterium]|nr:DUF5667 domain-containing protein [Candidatus Paceibacterota bacterium]